MNRLRPSATPNIKAKTMPTVVRAIGDRAISEDRIDNVPGRVSIVRLQKGKWRVHRGDMIVALHARRMIGIGKIDIHDLSSGRYRPSRSNFCHACLLSKTWLHKLSPDRSRFGFGAGNRQSSFAG